MEFLLVLGGVAVVAVFSAISLRRLALDRDHGRVVFRTVEELLKTRALDWEHKREMWSLGSTLVLSDAKIALHIDWGDLGDVEVAGRRLKPGQAWRKRLEKARKRMQAEQALYVKVTNATEAMESLAESNVIPLRR